MNEFMNVKQVAEYLDLNEKKVYQLANEARIPATKATGKWLFPRSLLDRWLLGSCHEGVMNDRLLLAGSDDVLLHYASAGLDEQGRLQFRPDIYARDEALRVALDGVQR